MSSDQMTRGLEMIASAAEKVDPHLGSRAVDLFRGIVRVSFEKEVQRAPDHNFGFRRLNSVESSWRICRHRSRRPIESWLN